MNLASHPALATLCSSGFLEQGSAAGLVATSKVTPCWARFVDFEGWSSYYLRRRFTPLEPLVSEPSSETTSSESSSSDSHRTR